MATISYNSAMKAGLQPKPETLDTDVLELMGDYKNRDTQEVAEIFTSQRPGARGWKDLFCYSRQRLNRARAAYEVLKTKDLDLAEKLLNQ